MSHVLRQSLGKAAIINNMALTQGYTSTPSRSYLRLLQAGGRGSFQAVITGASSHTVVGTFHSFPNVALTTLTECVVLMLGNIEQRSCFRPQ